MSHGKTRIILSRAWAVAVCSVGVALVALLGACRSKKAVATDREDVKVDPQERIREMQIKSDSLKQELDRRSRALIYGPPEVMQRRADENRRMREQADSLDSEIDKLRKSRQQ